MTLRRLLVSHACHAAFDVVLVARLSHAITRVIVLEFAELGRVSSLGRRRRLLILQDQTSRCVQLSLPILIFVLLDELLQVQLELLNFTQVEVARVQYILLHLKD